MATEPQSEQAYRVMHVTDLLRRASKEEGRPVLHMITKNRKSATFTVQVFVIVMPAVIPVDITAHVAAITDLKYSSTHRGVIIKALSLDVHRAIMMKLAVRLYSPEGLDNLTYRSL